MLHQVDGENAWRDQTVSGGASCRHDVISNDKSASQQVDFYACDAFDEDTVMITRLSV
jgi:hypothetical protein